MQNSEKKFDPYDILDNKKVAEDYFLMRLKAPWLSRYAKPGQFITIKVQEEVTDPLLKIPLAVHRFYQDGIGLLYRVVGKATSLLSHRRQGEKITVLGPLGNSFEWQPLLRTENPEVLLVAGGCGIAPLYALAQILRNENIKMRLFVGADTESHLVCLDDFEKLGASLHIATDDGTKGKSGHITEVLNDYLVQQASKVFIYASGPQPMLMSTVKIAQQFKCPTQLSLEAYMACGMGACLGCTIETKKGYQLCCQDGPVFDAELFEV
jgi:dihydroorotate dehydrogenase electron transfer subunit